MSNWLKLILVALLAMEAIGRILLVDKRREPITATQAAFGVLFNGALIWAIMVTL